MLAQFANSFTTKKARESARKGDSNKRRLSNQKQSSSSFANSSEHFHGTSSNSRRLRRGSGSPSYGSDDTGFLERAYIHAACILEPDENEKENN